MTDLNRYLIAMESNREANSISQITKKFPIKYPKELNNYQFDMKGNFNKSLKSIIEDFFYKSDWEKRFNNILADVLVIPKNKQKIENWCEKNDYKVDSFNIELVNIYFREYPKDINYNQMYINISFSNIDRYDAPGFPQLMQPILSQIIKSDIGNEWIVEKGEYPTDFNIYRSLTSKETKVLKDIQNSANEKQKLAKEKAAEAKKNRDQKNTERINLEIANNTDRFYKQSLKDQAIEIVSYFTENNKYYFDKYNLKLAENSLNSLKSIKLNPGEKVFKFSYNYQNSFDLWGEPVNLQRECYVVTSENSNYKKLEKVYFLNYIDITSETFESYMKKKALSKV